MTNNSNDWRDFVEDLTRWLREIDRWFDRHRRLFRRPRLIQLNCKPRDGYRPTFRKARPITSNRRNAREGVAGNRPTQPDDGRAETNPPHHRMDSPVGKPEERRTKMLKYYEKLDKLMNEMNTNSPEFDAKCAELLDEELGGNEGKELAVHFHSTADTMMDRVFEEECDEAEFRGLVKAVNLEIDVFRKHGFHGQADAMQRTLTEAIQMFAERM